jgi:hypothetical protein
VWILALAGIVTFQLARTIPCPRRRRGPSDEVPLIDGVRDDGSACWDELSYPYGTRQRA